MSTESPPTLRESLGSRTGQAVVILITLLSLYGVLIQAQVLLVVWLVSVALVLWLLYRLVRAIERIASAQERQAAAVGSTAASATRSEGPDFRSGVAEPGEQPDREDDRE